MTILNVIDRITNHQPGSFVCPVFDAGVTEVSVVIDRIPYTFFVRDVEPGWWVMQRRPHWPGVQRADVVREAFPSEYLPILESLPRFYVIVLYRLSPYTWLTVPYSTADAEQRGWENGVPRPLHLVEGSIEPLTVVDARLMNDTLVYTGPSLLLPPSLRNALRIIRDRERELKAREDDLRRQAEEAERLAQLSTLQGKLEAQLEFSNARLVDWSESGEDIRVTWEHGGDRHTMRVERSGRIRSSGICLSGRDGDFNLSAIVGVMEGE